MSEPVCIRNWAACFAAHKIACDMEIQENPAKARFKLINHLSCAGIVCWNGLIISAQASPFHYCDLRGVFLGGRMPDDWVMDGTLPTVFEVMVFTDQMPPDARMVLPHELDNAMHEPAGWVAIDVIEQCIRDNGGWVKDPAPPLPTTTNVVAFRKRKLEL